MGGSAVESINSELLEGGADPDTNSDSEEVSCNAGMGVFTVFLCGTLSFGDFLGCCFSASPGGLFLCYF